MTQRRYFAFLAIFLFFLIFVIYSINFYFLSRLNLNKTSQIKFAGDISETDRDESGVKLKSLYKSKNPKFDQIKNKIVSSFKPCNRTMSYSQLWSEVDNVRRLKTFDNLKVNDFHFSGPKKLPMKFILNMPRTCASSLRP